MRLAGCANASNLAVTLYIVLQDVIIEEKHTQEVYGCLPLKVNDLKIKS